MSSSLSLIAATFAGKAFPPLSQGGGLRLGSGGDGTRGRGRGGAGRRGRGGFGPGQVGFGGKGRKSCCGGGKVRGGGDGCGGGSMRAGGGGVRVITLRHVLHVWVWNVGRCCTHSRRIWGCGAAGLFVGRSSERRIWWDVRNDIRHSASPATTAGDLWLPSPPTRATARLRLISHRRLRLLLDGGN